MKICNLRYGNSHYSTCKLCALATIWFGFSSSSMYCIGLVANAAETGVMSPTTAANVAETGVVQQPTPAIPTNANNSTDLTLQLQVVVSCTCN